MRTTCLLTVSSMHCTRMGVGVSARGVFARGVFAQGGVCLGGVYPGDVYLGVSAQEGWCIPACTGADPSQCEQNDWQTGVKTLPCLNFVGGGNNRKYLISSYMLISDSYAFIKLSVQSTSLIPPVSVGDLRTQRHPVRCRSFTFLLMRVKFYRRHCYYCCSYKITADCLPNPSTLKVNHALIC